MRPISVEKRELVVSAKKRGEKPETIALWFEIGVRSVNRIWKQYVETNSVQPKKHKGRKPSISAEQLEAVRALVAAQNDITLEEIIEQLSLPIKKSRLSVILIGFDLSFKKRHCTLKNN